MGTKEPGLRTWDPGVQQNCCARRSPSQEGEQGGVGCSVDREKEADDNDRHEDEHKEGKREEKGQKEEETHPISKMTPAQSDPNQRKRDSYRTC